MYHRFIHRLEMYNVVVSSLQGREGREWGGVKYIPLDVPAVGQVTLCVCRQDGWG